MFLDRCQLLRETLDRPAITTDVIVGFPGETEEEFEQTLETCRLAGFSKIHAFPFSRRRGTPAADMPDQISKEVKAERVDRLIEVEAELRERYLESLIGSEAELLVEKREHIGDAVELTGTTERYATATLRAEVDRETDLWQENSLIKLKVQSTDGKSLTLVRS